MSCALACATVMALALATMTWLPFHQMSVLAFAVYAALKLLSLEEYLISSGRVYAGWPWVASALGYLLFWPGMDPRPFFATKLSAPRPRAAEWCVAIAKFTTGVALVSLASSDFIASAPFASPLLSGWIGAIGLLLMFHFGLFHILSVAWRHIGIDATPIMRTPLFAASLADFWSKRWNLAFRDWAHTFVFRPSLARFGAAAATLFVFLFSGIVHDVVVSIPAGAGYGMPTAYFLLQGAALLFERTDFAKQLGLGRGGPISRVYALVVVLAPAGMLFHRPFIENVIHPMLNIAS
jgi:hypothetical protein